MAASHTELVAWQLCDEFAAVVHALLTESVRKKDYNLYDQLHRSADAPAPLIAEGFGHRSPKQFAKYLTIAVSSLLEANNWLARGSERCYWPAQKGQSAKRLAERALDISKKLLASKYRQIAREDQMRKARSGRSRGPSRPRSPARDA